MRISKSAAFYLQASIIVFFLAGSSAPTPLYALYQARWGFSPITITVVFGVYALAVLASLLTVGSLSDHVGRRPVLLVAILLQAATMLIFAGATGVPMLVVARVIQGLSTGAAAAAVGAGMLDLDRERGTIANAVGPMTGTATGALLSGVMVQYLPAPTHLVYLLLFAIFIAQAIGVLLMAETRAPSGGFHLRLHVHLPPAVRRSMLVAAPALIAAWALAGFYGSLGPSLVRKLAGSSSTALGGLALFVIAASGSAAVLVLHRRDKRSVLALGAAALAAGTAITLLAVARLSLAGFFAGSVIAGAGFGASFQGAIGTVVGRAAASERAGVLSVLYILSYLAMGVPAVIAGALVVETGDVLATTQIYGATIMALATLACVGSFARRPTALAV